MISFICSSAHNKTKSGKSPVPPNLQRSLHNVQSALYDVQDSLHNASYTHIPDTYDLVRPAEEEQDMQSRKSGRSNWVQKTFKTRDSSRQMNQGQNLENCIRDCQELYDVQDSLHNASYTHIPDTYDLVRPAEEEQDMQSRKSGRSNWVQKTFKTRDSSRQMNQGQNLENCIRDCQERHGKGRAPRDRTGKRQFLLIIDIVLAWGSKSSNRTSTTPSCSC